MKHVLRVDVCEKDDDYVFTLHESDKTTAIKVNSFDEGFMKINGIVTHENFCFVDKEKEMRKAFKKFGLEEKFYMQCVACNKSYQSELWPSKVEDFICEEHKK